ncbi:MAG: polyprenyl synthetase family protein [Micrococcaceae bacterium]|nr:polyprenyl synthetase family protein [Micrococcaceae bacterium]
MSQPTRSARQSHAAPAEALPPETTVAVRHELQEIIRRQQASATGYSPATGIMWERIGSALGGGKLTRPQLVMLGFEAFGGTDTRNAVLLGCAFELLHGSLLMHDDMIDRDFVRRGKPTLSALYRDEALAVGKNLRDAEHAGHSAAVIAGDLLLATAIRISVTAASSCASAEAIIDSFQRCIHHAGAGELEDLLYSLNDSPAKVQDVLRMEELKTAGYSFQVPLETGALLAGASLEEAAAIGGIGSQLGVAYQLIDDVLGTFGDPGVTGKSIESDLREGKSTILTALASTTPAFSENLQLFRAQRVGIDTVRQSLEHTGAESLARQLADELCNAATQAALGMRLPPRATESIEGFASLILRRGA